jgi:hypothetical protein
MNSEGMLQRILPKDSFPISVLICVICENQDQDIVMVFLTDGIDVHRNQIKSSVLICVICENLHQSNRVSHQLIYLPSVLTFDHV